MQIDPTHKNIDTKPLVSVLVPVYNVETYLLESLESIAKQTYKNLEVIVIDDGSSDKTFQLAKYFSKRDARFKVYRNEKNMRIVETLNKGLQLAKGNFIARCDGDDIMDHQRIQRQYEFLIKHPDIALVGCSFRTIDETGRYLRDVRYPGGKALIAKLLPFCSPVSHIWLARREVYDTIGPYRLASVEDYDFLLRANLAGFGLDNIEEYFGMQVRVRAGNTVSQYGIVQRRLFNYAKSVNSQERKGNWSAYCKASEDAIKAESASGLLAAMHYQSDRLSHRAATSNSRFRHLWHVVACCCSPLKLQYYYNMIRCKLIKSIS